MVLCVFAVLGVFARNLASKVRFRAKNAKVRKDAKGHAYGDYWCRPLDGRKKWLVRYFETCLPIFAPLLVEFR